MRNLVVDSSSSNSIIADILKRLILKFLGSFLSVKENTENNGKL